jgi:YD repeat-containing protein
MINDCLDIINNANDLRNRISARFFYDRLGRIVVSQNSRQQAQNRFSYSLYDALGRVVEAGEKTENTPGTNVLAFTQIFGAYVGGNLVPSVIDDTKLETWLDTQANTTRKEITRSYYDRTNTSILAQLPNSFTPDPLTQRKRIVHVTYEAVYDSNDATYNHATHYDYDIHGNVKTLLQDNADLGALNQLASQRFKRMDYTFDLISGNVHRVDYETNKADQWHHAYSYDADNRITAVYTTSATPLVNDALAMSSLQNEPLLNPTWEKEAAYNYYAHGPLARTVIGEQEVQGLDYVYTLQGWIKGVNSNNLDANNDPGKDGLGLSANHRVAQDVMGYSLHYFNNDYLPIVNGNTTFIADQSNSDMLQNSSDLYNGNIARMVTTITDPNSRAVLPLGNAYRYDQLNRLKHAVSFDQLNGNAWAGGAPAKYENSFTYDANGNILTQTRNDDNNQVIDELAYFYPKNAANKTVRNRLLYVSDNVNYDAFDIDPGMATINYAYDAEGRLIKDLQEGIDEIKWRVDGKVKSIKQSDNKPGEYSLSFDYDAFGHRIAKHSYDKNQAYNNGLGQLVKSTYYVLDAQGNTMATYERAVDENTLQISYAQTEKFIYGSSRLGVQNCNIALLGSQNNSYTQTTVPHRIGKKGYELSNHLGNVLSVISDKVIPHSNGSTVDYWLADINQCTDFSAFHAPLSGRTLYKSSSTLDYRYGGSNGQEKTDEIAGNGNHYTAEYWEYDTRLGRRWNLDPVVKEHRSPYDVFSNNPIIMVDPNGDDDYYNSDGTYNSKMSKKYNNNGSHNIYVLSSDGKEKTLLTDMPIKTENERKIVERVISGYARKVGVTNVVRLKYSKSKNGKTLAFTYKKIVYVNSEGGITDKLSNYHNLESVLFHEKQHQDDQKAGKELNDNTFEGLLNHSKIYEKQMNDKSFERTSDDFKAGQFGSFGKYLENSLNQALKGFDVESDTKKVTDMINSFNEGVGKKYGYSISAKQTSIGGELTWDVNVKKTKK